MPSRDQLKQVIKIQSETAKLGLDLGRVMQFVVEETLPLVGAEGAAIELAEDGQMVYRAASGIAEPHLGLRLNMETSLSGHCVHTGEILHCSDCLTDDRVDKAACARMNLRSMIVLPLTFQDTTVGVLKAMSTSVDKFSEDDIEAIGMLCDLVAASMYYSVKYDIDKLVYRATHDSLTGLANRSLFMDNLKNSHQQTELGYTSLGLLMLDLDGLKQVNDELGHQAGDAMILEFSKRLKGATRSTDTVARIGGDEFAVLLLPFDKSDQLIAFTARIHEALAKPLAYNDRLISIQASIGSAELPTDGIDFNQLLEVADQRMYENKRRRKMSQTPE